MVLAGFEQESESIPAVIDVCVSLTVYKLYRARFKDTEYRHICQGFSMKKRQGSIFVIVCLTWQTTCRTKVAYLYLVDQKVYEKLCILTAAKKNIKKKNVGEVIKKYNLNN